ncbi:MAG: serine/threonine protein kinase [Deltaproteobacteria bacterium]|nr:serine/threonine protein kinase [Deltaproteobacteria bacterium]
MALSPPISLPAVFGRYVLLRRLSRGGMGEIFIAKLGEIRGFEKPLVLKMILPELAQDEEFLRRFITEAKIAITLSQANIVPVYEVGMVQGQYFLAMQYVEGRDLRAVVQRAAERRRRLEPALCLLVAREVASALAYAHRKADERGRPLHLVHCDVSPPNVLLSYEGEVKLIDFGVAKTALQLAQAREDVGFGKYGYMAPEQLVQGASVDRRADIYSTGVLLYELLTGQRLHAFPPDVDLRRVVREVTSGRAPLPSERDLRLGDRFDALVSRAMNVDPAARFQSAEELRDAIQQVLYALEPTITTDRLAASMQELFPEESVADRSMLRSATQTDLARFRDELHDATHRTVSLALGPQWAPVVGARAAPTVGAEEGDSAEGGGTRPLSATARRAAAEPVGGVVAGGTARRRRFGVKRLLAVAAGAAVATLVATAVWLAADLGFQGASGPQSGDSTGGDTDSDGRVFVRVLPPQGQGEVDGRASAAGGARAEEPDAEGPDAGVGEAPEAPDAAVRPSQPTRRGSAGTRRGARRSASRRPVLRREAPITSAQVQAKFQQVRLEYQRFASAYGARLDREWQRILFANTYGTMDEQGYRRLSRMLDELRQKMAVVRKGSGG